MQKLVIITALMAAAYFGYQEYSGPGGHGFASSRGGGVSIGSSAARGVAGGVSAAAGRIAN